MAYELTPFTDVAKMIEQFRMPGVDMSAIVEARRKDIEALLEANKAAYAAVQALARKQTQMLAHAMHGVQETARSMGMGVGLNDPAKQAEMMRDACAKALADMKDLADLARDSQADTMAHITQRTNQHLLEIKKLMMLP